MWPAGTHRVPARWLAPSAMTHNFGKRPCSLAITAVVNQQPQAEQSQADCCFGDVEVLAEVVGDQPIISVVYALVIQVEEAVPAVTDVVRQRQ